MSTLSVEDDGEFKTGLVIVAARAPGHMPQDIILRLTAFECPGSAFLSRLEYPCSLGTQPQHERCQLPQQSRSCDQPPGLGILAVVCGLRVYPVVVVLCDHGQTGARRPWL
jgi:hypothetical protein